MATLEVMGTLHVGCVWNFISRHFFRVSVCCQAQGSTIDQLKQNHLVLANEKACLLQCMMKPLCPM